MKMQDEDFGRERQDETLTDDEENQADSMGEIEDDSGSESSSTHSTPTRNPSDGIDIQPTWPQSYRYVYISVINLVSDLWYVLGTCY